MTKFNASIAALGAALLLSGNAFAATVMPASGEGPFFNDQPVVSSSLQRAEVRADATRHLPASDEFSNHAEVKQAASAVTRAEVRQDTRDAIAHGFRVASGENA
ncbi:MAG TPA: hypothetical protein PKA16_13125 [Ottowia sp.]|uniref:hypothetical protein n=1 Tax=Ottowia sp. TaxID=1898956 RepID=UPI002CD949FF|nr:hypothetical protein [Ottowia sp.]HMN22319.1 hypothetical protein [Ottowia sp.]